MPKSFNLALPPNAGTRLRDKRFMARVIIGTLLAGNLIAAYFVARPMGGSAEELNADLLRITQQIAQKQRTLRDLKTVTTKVSTARSQMDAFQMRYFLNRTTTSSTLVSELIKDAKEAGIKTPRAQSFVFEEVEGVDNLEIVSITADYECGYKELIKFLELMDKSDHLLIIESLQAAPRQQAGVLGFTMKLSAFARREATT